MKSYGGKMSFDLEKIFQKGIKLHHYANTAYPLDGRKVWRNYKVKKEKINEAVRKHWQGVKELGLYVHIPFCQKRCLYCEYTVLSGDEAELKSEYVGLLLKEIKFYKEIFKKDNKIAVGLDIGGGTPSMLSPNSISKIIKSILSSYKLSQDFAISIETTPQIAASDIKKMQAIRKLGIERISMGMQTIDPQLLKQVGRENNTTDILTRARNNIRKAGFKKFNIDLMYGFLNQTPESFLSTVKFAIQLGPEFITLYRNRYKKTRLEKDSGRVMLNQVNEQYNTVYDSLIKAGYEANIGKNTFSKIRDDPGTSAYLTKRVIEETPYLGFGLGAQSLADGAIYYNQGAASKKIGEYGKLIQEGNFPIQDFYALPPAEIMAKVISVSFYFGQIDKIAFQKKFKGKFEEKFKEEVDFLLKKGLMEHRGEYFSLTEKGKNKVNGIIPLFYSEVSKQNLLERI